MRVRWINFFCVALIFGMGLISCDNKSIPKQAISAKWNIEDKNSQYSSFEFTVDNVYIVVETLNNIHTGKYGIEGKKITLEGFGIIEIISIAVEKLIFSFMPENSNEKYEYNAMKVKNPIDDSSRTAMLCRFWRVDKVNDSSYSPEIGLGVLYSKAGTYLVTQTDGTTELAEWKWGDTEETMFYYSWGHWDYENSKVNILQLSATMLKLQEPGRTYELVLGQ